jgi:hypothetical protein
MSKSGTVGAYYLARLTKIGINPFWAVAAQGSHRGGRNMTILEDVLQRLQQAVPEIPIFPHKHHAQVILAVIQQIVIKYVFIDPAESQQILLALREESRKYIAKFGRYVSPADYEVVWPDIEIILAEAAKQTKDVKEGGGQD